MRDPLTRISMSRLPEQKAPIENTQYISRAHTCVMPLCCTMSALSVTGSLTSERRLRLLLTGNSVKGLKEPM